MCQLNGVFINVDRIDFMICDYDFEVKDYFEYCYVYDFDYWMYEFMIWMFVLFFVNGNVLEFGCFEGNFIWLVVDCFQDLEVVEVFVDCVVVVL